MKESCTYNKSEETSNTPQLRFPGFTGEWEEKKLGEIGTTVTGLTYSPSNVANNGLLVLRSSNIKNDSLCFDDCVYVREINRYNPVQENDILICVRNGSSSLIGKSALIPKGLSATFGAFMMVFRSKDWSFVFQLLKTDRYRELIEQNLGARINSINSEDFKQYSFLLPPSPAEQQKIADCLSSLDDMIRAEGQKTEALREYKRGLMQQLFPANGATTPQLRFPEFTGEWKEKKLGDCYEERNEQYPETEEYPLMAFIAHKGIAPKGEKYDRSALVKDVSQKKYKRTELGDFIYSSNNLESGSIGLNNYGNACISPVYSIFKAREGYISTFLGTILTQKSFISQMIKFRQGVVYGQWKIPEKEFLGLKIYTPSPSEQQKIADCLSSLDDMITAQANKTEALREYKRGLMQQLFPQPSK